MLTVSSPKHRAVHSSIVLAFSTLLLPVVSSVAVQAQDKATVNPTSISVSAAVSNREQDGLSGPVRRVRTQIAKITTEAGKPVETPKLLLGVTSYDLQGNRTDSGELWTAARRLIFAKGSDSHDYKYSSAVLEDYYHTTPAWRDRFLAASMFWLKGFGSPDSALVAHQRAVL